jgi:hypothetical protein
MRRRGGGEAAAHDLCRIKLRGERLDAAIRARTAAATLCRNKLREGIDVAIGARAAAHDLCRIKLRGERTAKTAALRGERIAKNARTTFAESSCAANA